MLDSRSPAPAALRTLTKVPQVTALFWTIKILTTGMGETLADYLGDRIDRDTGFELTTAALIVSLLAQIFAREYHTWLYWWVVALIGVWGTQAADTIDFRWHTPLQLSTAIMLAVLATVFALWFATQRTLSMAAIDTRGREMFYWATVLVTFMLGTAAGDLTADKMHLGYRWSIVIFAVLIALPALARRALPVSPVAAFWFAYVITRPLGASISDWLAWDRNDGRNLGTGPVTLIAALAMVALVALAAHRENGQRNASADR